MLRKILLIVIGFLALGLGAVGVALPVLPTTPFVLCAAGCFAASSPSLYSRLENTRYFGEYVQNYRDKKGISEKARWMGIVFLWTTLIVSAVVFQSPMTWVILGIVGICVTVHILLIRKKKR